MAKKAIALPAISNSIYDLLKPLDSPDRLRAINAALTLLGDTVMGSGGKAKAKEEDPEDEGSENADFDLSAKGRAWMRRYKVTEDQIGNVFDLDGETAEVIADEVPGDSAKVKTINAYVITGIAHFLKTGDVKFEDDAARAVCKHIGCLNPANHSSYMAAKKNLFNGSKKTGWKLTAPGLRKGAELVTAIVTGDD